MSVNITIKVRFGPLVSLDVNGENCQEISEALKGFELLNKQIDTMCSDLAERIYPEGMGSEAKEDSEVQQ